MPYSRPIFGVNQFLVADDVTQYYLRIFYVFSIWRKFLMHYIRAFSDQIRFGALYFIIKVSALYPHVYIFP